KPRSHWCLARSQWREQRFGCSSCQKGNIPADSCISKALVMSPPSRTNKLSDKKSPEPDHQNIVGKLNC
ncbi:hypothetical protein, partial [Enterococcus faecalis]|uniref:hypothetical protein n=1 Tax=Enterococcus faecalis TaxID=1351 RepID=UPI00403F5843